MAHIRDFESILPNPQPYVEKTLALYGRAVREKRGRVVFIAAELGGGKTDLLNALAQALHQAKPEPTFVAGYFRGGQYYRHTLHWPEKICLKKAVQAIGETAALLGFIPGLYSFAASFVGQLLQTSASAHEFGNEFKKHPSPGQQSADWFRKLLRRTAEEKPLVCLLDDWDEAQRFFWDEMLLSFAMEIAQDLPLLLFLTVKEPINLAAPEKDPSGLSRVINGLINKGLAEWWHLPKLSQEEVTNFIGPAAPGIAAKLIGVTGGNARWLRELWREWRLNEIVVMNEADRWGWGPQHKATINLYQDILRDRLARLLNADTAMEVEDAREVLACAALEGTLFTADAVARTLGCDRDELMDFLDEKLAQSEDNPDGLLFEDDNVTITTHDGATTTLWRYSFVSDLHWLALDRYGFSNEARPDKSDSEKLEKIAAFVEGLEQTYAPDERLVAGTLARLLRSLGHKEPAQHYQRLANYSANRDAMREHALYLLAVNKDDWEQWPCTQAAEFLIEAGKAMLHAFSYDETRAVLEEAAKLAHRAKCDNDEAYARYLCGYILKGEGDNKSARANANDSLDIFTRTRKKSGIAVSLHLLAQLDYDEGRFDDARRQATRSLEITQELGIRTATAGLLLLAQINHTEGHYDEARKQAIRSLEIDQEIGNLQGIAIALHRLGEIDFAEGHYDYARKQITRSLEIHQELGKRTLAAVSLHSLAAINYVEGRFDDARRRARESMIAGQEIGDRNGTAASLHLLARIDYGEGRYDDARRQATQSLEIHQAIGYRHGTAASLHVLANIAGKLQRPTEAFDLMALGVLILTEIGDVAVQMLQDDLADLVAAENYSEEQQVEMHQAVLEAYQKDGGKELIENAVAGLGEVDPQS